MSDQVQTYYVKMGETVWYFSDINRRHLIEQGVKTITEFMQTKPTREQFDQHPGIQRILREVPECRASYQKHIRQTVEFDSDSPIL